MDKIEVFAIEDYYTTKYYGRINKLPFIHFTQFENIGLIYLN